MSTPTITPEGNFFVGSLRVMDVYERRRIHLALLLKEISQSKLAERSGVSASYINRSLKEPGEKGAKNIGEVTARKLEAGGKKPEGWLDGNQVGQATSIPPSTNFGTPAATQTDPPLVIPQYAAGGGMGRGFNLTDNPPGHIKSWHVDHEWLRLNVPAHTGLRNLAIVTGFGPSMRPMFNPGDPLLVDTGVRHIDHEGVYFFRVGEEGFIKLIQRVPEFDGPGVILRVISKNPDFPPYDISPKNPHFEVLGKVLTIWRSENF